MEDHFIFSRAAEDNDEEEQPRRNSRDDWKNAKELEEGKRSGRTFNEVGSQCDPSAQNYQRGSKPWYERPGTSQSQAGNQGGASGSNMQMDMVGNTSGCSSKSTDKVDIDQAVPKVNGKNITDEKKMAAETQTQIDSSQDDLPNREGIDEGQQYPVNPSAMEDDTNAMSSYDGDLEPYVGDNHADVESQYGMGLNLIPETTTSESQKERSFFMGGSEKAYGKDIAHSGATATQSSEAEANPGELSPESTIDSDSSDGELDIDDNSERTKKKAARMERKMQDQLVKSLEMAEKNAMEGVSSSSGERKRSYSSSLTDDREKTEEEMEAYVMKRSRQEDRRCQFM